MGLAWLEEKKNLNWIVLFLSFLFLFSRPESSREIQTTILFIPALVKKAPILKLRSLGCLTLETYMMSCCLKSFYIGK